jgi:hypothetical protein
MGANSEHNIADGDLVQVTVTHTGTLTEVDDNGYLLTLAEGETIRGAWNGPGLRSFEKLQPEPADGTMWVDQAGIIWARYDHWAGSTGTKRWYSNDDTHGPFTWPLLVAEGDLTQLLRADKAVALPTTIRDRPQVGPGNNVSAWVYEERGAPVLVLRVAPPGSGGVSQSIDLTEAETWLLDVLALVRSKGGQ